MNAEWKAVPGLEGYYEAHPDGFVRSMSRPALHGSSGKTRMTRAKVLGGESTHGGYTRLHLCVEGVRERRLLHAVILETFSGPRPDGYVARHLNGDPGDNRSENLAWGTYKENSDDRERHGRATKGETSGSNKMTEAEVRAIRHHYSVGAANQYELAAMFGLSQPQVSQIIRRGSWAHVS